MTLDQNVEKELADARKYAEQGNASTMQSCLSLAQTYAQRAGQDVSVGVTEIERIGYAKAVPVELADARKYAEQGNASTMGTCLSLAQRYAQRVGQDITAGVTEIERIGYAKAVPVELADARKYADQGRASTMQSCLSLAQKYAQRAGQDITAQVAEIRAWLKE